jgi:hypothetical protein
MSDTHTKDTYKPKDQEDQQDHFVELHHDQESRIKKLENTVRLICETHLAGRVTSLEASRVAQWERIKALEILLAKQRAVNEILLRYNDDDPVLAAALRETLKP